MPSRASSSNIVWKSGSRASSGFTRLIATTCSSPVGKYAVARHTSAMPPDAMTADGAYRVGARRSFVDNRDGVWLSRDTPEGSQAGGGRSIREQRRHQRVEGGRLRGNRRGTLAER